MTLLLALAHVAAAAPPPGTPWPADTPLTFTFTYGMVSGFIDEYGKGTFIPVPPLRYTWTCRARPANRAGKQQMTCDEPGLGSVWMMWGPGRELLSYDIDEDASDLGDDRHHHRVSVLAGQLELWPPEPKVTYTWQQGGRFQALRVSTSKGNSTFALTNTVRAVEGARVTIGSAGSGTFLLGTQNDADARVEVGVEGEAVVDTASGMLVRRTVRVYPVRYSVGTYGTLGHEVTVEGVVGGP